MPVGRRKGDDAAIRQRVDQLERLVRQLMSDRGSALSSDGGKDTSESVESHHGEPSPGVSIEKAIPAAIGKTVLDGSHSVNHEGSDWHAVLQEVPRLPHLTRCLSDRNPD